jgi:hypothetical protein
MAKQKSKPVDPWPPFDSPERVTYADRWPLPQAVYNEARVKFTPENIEKIRRVLNPPDDFALEERLRRAVYEFHHIAADLLCHLGQKPKKVALAKIKGPVENLLGLIESKPYHFAELYAGSFEVGHDLAEILKDLKKRIDQAKTPTKLGRQYNHPRKVFFALLLACHEDATGREAKAANLETRKLTPAFRFFQTAHNLLIEEAGDENINQFLKPPARRRARVYLNLSKLA